MNSQNPALDELCINTIRFLSVDAVQQANSGHPGMPMGAAPMAYVLWTKFLRHSPRNPGWLDRDRFVLSAGHGSMLLYSLLHLSGYDLSLDDLKNFRQWGSKTPGHPEYGDIFDLSRDGPFLESESKQECKNRKFSGRQVKWIPQLLPF